MYQGWVNYETWNAALWMGNDEAAYNATMNQIVFNVTQQHKKGAADYAEALQRVAARHFNGKTPDGVVLTDARSKVDWGDIVDYYKDDIKTLETEWLDLIGQLATNATGGFIGILDAASDFRNKHKYGVNKGATP